MTSSPATLENRMRAVSMRSKILWVVVATCSAGIILAGLALFAHQALTLRTQFRSQMTALTRVVADFAVAPTTFGDERGIREAMTVLESRPDVLAAQLRSVDNALLMEFGDPNIIAAFPAAPLENSAFVGWNLRVNEPLLAQTDQVGHLVMVATFRPTFWEAVQNFAPALVLTILGVLSLVGPFVWMLAGWLISGLKRLAASADRIASTADYSVRAEVGGKDEVGHLTATFNAMLNRLQESDQSLRTSNQALSHEIKERSRLEKALLESSRLAGMAEVATGVLHNVGNVLTSINVAAQLAREHLDQSRLSALGRVAHLLEPYENDPQRFYREHPKANLLPRLLRQLHGQLETERHEVRREITTLNQNIEHVKEIVTSQQNFASNAGFSEKLVAAELVEEALQIQFSSLARHHIVVERKLTTEVTFISDRHAVLQILVNLVSNAVHALKSMPPADRRMIVGIETTAQALHFYVRDFGKGIEPANLTRVFQHGFTTRKDGHGFGLHSGANSARQMGGQLLAESDGPGRGATFTLLLPISGAAPLLPSRITTKTQTVSPAPRLA
ncbi:ATP-binding protein [Synoicihabitans lomoniglobus]|uniref:histidine kinase n=1 Tax=Synoicihabitans lomoniglobus TaxID=2909285 RepID=A0AAE9ZS58_9BACT|nr:HAMP domain-containing protein [Opitutaceae bacterium LMO-M01]WED63207.1 HAMP domain-containing protein [Opitutaceae bacterium LMO-M01]